MSDLPILLIELVLVFGGVLALAVWQLRDLRREREARKRALGAGQPPESDGPGAGGAP